MRKRPIEIEQLQQLVLEVEKDLKQQYAAVPTSEIGTYIMRRLMDIDEVAYVRFASVYREFKDVNTFMEELGKLLQNK